MQDLIFRLRIRADIRRKAAGRRSVLEGKPDRLSDLLEEAADEIHRLRSQTILGKVKEKFQRNKL